MIEIRRSASSSTALAAWEFPLKSQMSTSVSNSTPAPLSQFSHDGSDIAQVLAVLPHSEYGVGSNRSSSLSIQPSGEDNPFLFSSMKNRHGFILVEGLKNVFHAPSEVKERSFHRGPGL